MRRTSIYLLISTILIFSLMTFYVSQGLLSSSVTLASTGNILPGNDPGFGYIIYQSAGINYVQNVSTGSNIYSSSSVVSTFSKAFSLVSTGGKITVFPGTYVATGQVTMASVNNVNLVFEPGAVLTIGNHVDATVLSVSYSNNVNLTNLNIDGNRANQGTPWITDGIYIYDSSNVRVDHAYITNVFRDGFAIGDDVAGNLPSGITNSLITYCGWNGMTLGSGGLCTVGAYAINNEVAYCSDVGITSYGIGTQIVSNYVHDMNLSFHTDAFWGIGVEENGGTNIINNNVVRGGVGIALMTGSNLVKDNNIDSNTGISVGGSSGGNVITQNYIANYASGYNFGIDIYYGKGNTVSFNTIHSSQTSNQYALYFYNSSNALIQGNDITSPRFCIAFDINANNATIENNTLTGNIGINIGSPSDLNNKILRNTYYCSVSNITDLGTGTIIIP